MYLSADVYIPIITRSYLSWCDTLGSDRVLKFYDSLLKRGTAILPVFRDTDAIIDFGGIIKDVHAVPLGKSQTVDLMNHQLNRFLPDDALYDTVRNTAFSGSIFLSYRKKNIEQARAVMKAIHDAKSANCVAIWIDEFLIAGRDYEDQIRGELSRCDAVALVVTPNLLEKDNYVLKNEYPWAHEEFNKNIIPIETLKTDRIAIKAAYDGIESVTDVKDTAALDKRLQEKGFRYKELSPDEEYLLGMAFYRRIGVESDIERAFRLLESAAKRGNADACMQIAFFYTAGIGAKRNLDTALEYMLQAKEYLDKDFENDPVSSIHRLYDLLYGSDGLCLRLKTADRCDDAKKISADFRACLRKINKDAIEKYDLYLAESYLHAGDIFYEQHPSAQAIDEEFSNLWKAASIIKQSRDETSEMNIVYAQVYGCMADCAKAKLDYDNALADYKQAKIILSNEYNRTERIESLRSLLPFA